MRSTSAKSLAVLGVSLAVLALAGCGKQGASADPTVTASPSTPASASPSVSITPSTTLDAITVSGDYGKAPKVKVKAPWAIDATKAKVLKPSNGRVVQDGDSVEVNYYGVDGRTGKVFDQSWSRKSTAAFNLDQVVPGFKKGLLGQREGSRVLLAMPGSDGYDASGGSPDAGIEVGDTLIFVVDLVGVQLTGPEGETVKPAAGLPTVGGTAEKPSITIPTSGDAPKDLVAQTLIKGTGKKVGASDTITFKYLWVAWKDGRVLEQNYGDKPASYELSGLLEGMTKGLTGKTVGSRVLLVIPPSLAYPDGNADPKVDKGETLVMLVDLLFTSGTG